jgi:hypothetical protein
LLPIGSLDEFLIPVGPVFQLKCKSLAWAKSIRGPQRNVKISEWASNRVCLFTEIYWSLDKIIMNQYCGECYAVVLKKSLYYYFSNIFSPLGNWEMQQLIREEVQVLI